MKKQLTSSKLLFLVVITISLFGCKQQTEPNESDQINYSQITLNTGETGEFGFIGGEELHKLTIRFDGYVQDLPVVTYPNAQGNLQQFIIYSKIINPYGKTLPVNYEMRSGSITLWIVKSINLE